jgi:Immunity protein 50
MLDELRDVTFHDAEVVALRLNRDGIAIELDVEVYAQTPEARTVRLRFQGVSDVEFGGFNEQNVLFDLKLVRSDDAPLWDVTLEPSYGLGGSFRCVAIRVASSGSHPDRKSETGLHQSER